MKKIYFIISVAAFTGVLILSCLWIFGSLKVSVVTLDTFIGVSVAVLAIVFTVVIGFQIINAIDIKDRMVDVERQQNKLIDISRQLAENDRLHTKEAYNLQAGICDQSAEIRMAEANYVEAFCSCHSALLYAILADQQNQINRITHMNNIILLINKPPVVSFELLKSQLILECTKIRETVSYRNCLSSAYENTLSMFWTKMQQYGFMGEIKAE